jgi:two-component system, cell cycle response regulator DivK
MAGEQILIIDDTPVNLKLTRILLANEGYDVRTAPDAEQALAMLDGYRPELMLVDIQLPGMSGLDFTRLVKANPSTHDIVVVALTAFAMKGDEQKALEAGCDGYITKPIDTRSLPVRLRQYLATRCQPIPATPAVTTPPVPAAAAEPFSLAGPEIEALRRRFLAEGVTQCRQLLDSAGGGFDAAAAGKTMHQWVGAAGLLGYSEISRMAREIEQLLRERPLDNAQLREAITDLTYGFTDPPEAQPFPIPDSIAGALSGKRFALVGFREAEAERLTSAMDRVGARPRLLSASEPATAHSVEGCDLIAIHVRAETVSSAWLAPGGEALPDKPLILIGDRESLLGLDSTVQFRASEFLMDAWQPEEALMRASLALSRQSPGGTPAGEPGRGLAEYPRVRTSRPQVVLADDDPTVLALVRSTLLNYGMDVRTAANGSEALDLIHQQPPDAAILDVNMPGMDGFELLAAIRSQNIPIRVILLTARQQEGDLVRGFTLGADDYVVKPFSPMELVARLKRLLWR